MSIKGLHVVKKTMKNGAVRYYYYAWRGGPKFWTSDKERIDRPGARLPPEFLDAYRGASTEERRRPPVGSFGDTISLYQERSPSFGKMKPKGCMARMKYLDRWRDMPLKSGLKAEAAPLSVFDNRKIIKYITAYRDDIWGHSPSAADEAVIALSAFLSWCKKDGRLDWNRAQGIEQLYQRPTTTRIWSPEEQKLFLTGASEQLATGFRLALHTGLRREDLVRLPVSAIFANHIIVPTGKSRGRNTAIIPITPPLRALLEHLDAVRSALPTPPTTVLFSSRGRPWTAEGFGTVFDRHRDRIGLGAKDKGPSLHDLRKTAATHMVILQHRFPTLISDQVLLDLFGWTPGTLAKMKRIYVSDEALIEAITRTEQEQNL